MKVLMLAQFATPIIGGEEQYVHNLSVELVQRGHQVAIATIEHGDLPEFEIIQGVRIHRLRGTIQRINRLFNADGRMHAPPFPDPELMRGIQRVMQLEQPDIVHAHNWLLYSYLPLAIKKTTGLVVTLHDYSLMCATKRFMYHGQPCTGPAMNKCIECCMAHYGAIKGAPIYFSNQVMGNVERKFVDMFLAVSQATAKYNGLIGSGLPFQIVPNFVPDEVLTEIHPPDPLLARLPEGDFMLFVGDLSLDKGVGVLLKAYERLINPPALVLIGRSTNDTPTALPANVIKLGSWPHAAVMQAWKRSMIALVPSTLMEAFGMVVIEAMASGRPVIASKIGGIADIVIDGESGLLVTPNDVGDLQHAMERLLGDPDLRLEMGMKAASRSRDFHASTVLPRIEEIYTSIVSRKAAANHGSANPHKVKVY